MKLPGAGFGGEIDDRAAALAILGLIAGGFDVEFRQRIGGLGRIERALTGRIRPVDAVQRGDGGCSAGAVDAGVILSRTGAIGVSRTRESGQTAQQTAEGKAAGKQRLNLVLIEIGGAFGALDLNGSGVGLHGNGFAGAADHERKGAGGAPLTFGNDNVLLFQTRETGGLNGDGVSRGRGNSLEGKVAAIAGLEGNYRDCRILVG